VTSQLAALSTIRRAAGREDILFDPALLREYERAYSLTKIVDLASSQLDADERAFLAIAAAAKFVEIRHYRRFRFTNEDRLYVARILGKHLPRLDWETRKRLISNVLYLLRPKFGLRKLALRVFPQLATRL
jgi:hypothetical protein